MISCIFRISFDKKTCACCIYIRTCTQSKKQAKQQEQKQHKVQKGATGLAHLSFP